MAGGTDGNWVLTKSKRTDTRANLTISNRDTEAFEFALEFDKESCRWNKLPVMNLLSMRKNVLTRYR